MADNAKEHLLRMKHGDIALVINQDEGWFKKVSLAFADEPKTPTDFDPNWLGLYRACTHLSLIADTYLRTRQGLMQDDGQDIVDWQEDLMDELPDPEELVIMLENLGYPVPQQLTDDIEAIEEELKKEKEERGNVIPFPTDNSS